MPNEYKRWLDEQRHAEVSARGISTPPPKVDVIVPAMQGAQLRVSWAENECTTVVQEGAQSGGRTRTSWRDRMRRSLSGSLRAGQSWSRSRGNWTRSRLR